MAIEPEKAKKIILNNIKPVRETETVKIDNALGRVISEDIKPSKNIPKFDESMRDGYAIRKNDLKNSDYFKEVEKDKVSKNEAKWVGTGKKMPKGADTLVMVEKTEKRNNKIMIKNQDQLKRNVIPKGSTIKKNKRIMKSETLINERNIGILPTIEKEKVKVYKKPEIGLIATGNEITEKNDVNTRTLSSIIKNNNGKVKNRRVEDDTKKLQKQIKDHKTADLIITIGGTSKGRKDITEKAINNTGNLIFNQVETKPGKTFTFGEINNTPIFSLSGTPTPCLIQAYTFLKPAIRKLNHLNQIKKQKLKNKKTITRKEHRVLSKGSKNLLPAKKTKNNKIKPIFGNYMSVLPFQKATHLIELNKNKNKIKKDQKIKATPLKN